MSSFTGILEYHCTRRATEAAAGDAEGGAHRRTPPSSGLGRRGGARADHGCHFTEARE